MNDEKEAIGGDYRWLNFSIHHDVAHTFDECVDYECKGPTAQYQLKREGAWPMLSRDPTNDPPDTWVWPDFYLEHGHRRYYPELAAVAPTGMNPPTIQLRLGDPNPASRAHLDIRWRGTNFLFVFAVANWQTMAAGDRLDHTRCVMRHLIEQMPLGSALGIISFNASVQTLAPLTVITSAADRVTLQHAMDNLVPAGDKAAMGDALQAALTQIRAFGWSDEQTAVFLLCDGTANAGSDPLTAVTGFQDEQIPIMTFGFGDAQALDPRLATLAQQTGGRYFQAPGTLAQLAEGFQNAFAEVAGQPKLAQGWHRLSSQASAVSIPFEVDAALRPLTVSVSHALPAATLYLRMPNGQLLAPSLAESTAAEELLTFVVPQPQAGSWAITGTVAQGDTLFYQAAAGVTNFTYNLEAVCPQGETVVFPNPVQIVARLQREAALNGAMVTATLRDAQTNLMTVAMTNTVGGFYRATLLLSNGLYAVAVAADNAAGKVMQTWNDGLPASDDGELPDPVPDEPISANFTRTAAFQVTVTGTPANLAAPEPPDHVLASDGDEYNFVRVSWTAVTNASLYEVWRAAGRDPAAAVKAGERICSYTNWVDTNAVVGTVYNYWVKARNLKGTSGLGTGNEGWVLLGPDILVNEVPSAAVATGAFVQVSARLRTGAYAGVPCDWWVAALAVLPEGVCLLYLDSSLAWVPASDVAEFRPIYQGPIFDLETYALWSSSSLPIGTYYFYFGLDPLDGVLDPGNLVYDWAKLAVNGY
jgi:hypothetical protein